MKLPVLISRIIYCSAVVVLPACTDYEPIPVSECEMVVAHAQKVLGNFAPSYADMLKDCKAATDSERGCVIAATKKGQVAQCM